MASTDPEMLDASVAALVPLGSHANAPDIELRRPVTLIGSRKEIVRLHLQSSTVSKAHAVVVRNAWGCYVHDLGSRTGTLVNGKPVVDHDLVDGDVLSVGRFRFRYRAPADAGRGRFPAQPVELAVDAPTASLVSAELTRRVVTIGRRTGCDVQLSDSRVSNIHAILVEQDGRRLVRDLTSRTGTRVGGALVHQEPFAVGDELVVGPATLTLRPFVARLEPQADAGPAGGANAGAETARPAYPTIELHDADVAVALGSEMAFAGPLDLAPLDAQDAPDVSPLEPDGLTAPAAEARADVPADDLAALRREWTSARPAEPLPLHALELSPLPPAEPAPAEDFGIDLAPARRDPDAPVAGVPIADVPAVAERPADADFLDRLPPGLATPPAEDLPDLLPVAEPAAEALPPLSPLDDLERAPADGFDLPTVTAVPDPDAPAAAVLVSEAPTLIDEASSADEAADDLAPDPIPVAEAGPDEDAAAPAAPPYAVRPAEPAAAVAPAPRAVDEPELAIFDEADLAEAKAAPPVRLEPDGPAVADAAGRSDTTEAEADAGMPAVAVEPEPIDFIDAASMPLAPAVAVAAPLPAVDGVFGLIAEADAEPLAFVDEPSMPAAPPLAVADAPTLELPADAPATAGTAEDEPADGLLAPGDADLIEAEPVRPPAAETDADPLARDGAAVGPGPEAVLDAPAPAAEERPVLLTTLDEVPALLDGTADMAVVLTTPDEAPAAGDVTIVGGAVSDIDAEVEAPDFELPTLEDEIGLPDGTPADAPADHGADRAVADLALHAPAAETPAHAVVAFEPIDVSPPPPVRAERVMLPEDITPIEPDLVRLDDDLLSEDDEDATAMAVDLGLTLDDDAEPAAAPSMSPVEIDLAAAVPVTPELPTADGANDVFEADVLGPSADAGGRSTARPADAADAGTLLAGPDHIPAPNGGSLADLMPSGGPLLGGSFMAFPPMLDPPALPPSGPMAPAAEAADGDGAGGGNGLQKRRPLRVGFGAQQRPGRAPFSSERTIADVMGRPAAAADAFSQSAPAAPAAEFPAASFPGASFPAPSAAPITEATPVERTPAVDDFEQDGVGDASSGEASPARQRPRGVVRPVLLPAAVAAANGLAAPAPADAVVTAGDDAPARVRLHRKRVRRVIGCLVAAVTLAGAAVWAVYNYVPVRSTIDAMLTFEGLDRLGSEDATQFRARQNELLASEPVRQGAVTSLPPTLARPADYGFLAGGGALAAAVDADPKVRWPADQPSVMRLRVRSGDKPNDLARLRVLAQAMVNAAEPDRRRRDTLADAVRFDETQIAQKRSRLGDLNDQLQALRQAADDRPDPAKLAALNAEFAAAEPQLTGTKARRQELEATVELLKQPLATPATQPAAADPAAADTALNDLNQKLAALQQAPITAPDAGSAERAKLNDAIGKFQADLATAQKLHGDTPELTAYVNAANSSFAKIKDLTDRLLEGQERQITQLNELKARMSERVQGRIQDLVDKDGELKKLNDRLAILVREKNAAEASGMGEAAKKSDLETAVVKTRIGEREDVFRNDPVYTGLTTELQTTIAQMETAISADRKSVNQTLAAEHDDFLKNAPSTDKLPAEQKLMADVLARKMTAVTDARQAYDAAMDKAQSQAAKTEADSREQAAALRKQIAARRADVLAAAAARQFQDDAATRQKKLDSAQAELADVRQQEQTALHRVSDAAAAIESAEKRQKAYQQSQLDTEAKLVERDKLEQQLKEAVTAVSNRNADLAKLIVPDRTPEMHDFDDADRRPLWAGLAAGGIVVAFLIPAIANVLALAHENHPQPTRPANPPGDAFEPLLNGDTHDRKALPEPASV